MGIESAVQAYRQSAYQYTEYTVEKSLGMASLPLLGGTLSWLKQAGNIIYRPFKMAGALLFGGEYPVETVHRVEIPADVVSSQYGQALVTSRNFLNETADKRAEGVRKLLHFDVFGYFQSMRQARYTLHQQEKVVLPDEGKTLAELAMGAGLAVAARLAFKTAVGTSLNHVIHAAPVEEIAPPAIVPVATATADTIAHAAG